MPWLKLGPEISTLEGKRKLPARGFAFALAGNPGLVQHATVFESWSKLGAIVSLVFCRMLMTFYVKTELVSSISKRDLGDSDVAGRGEEEEEEEKEGMGGPCAVPQPGEVNHSWVQDFRRRGGRSPFMGNYNW